MRTRKAALGIALSVITALALFVPTEARAAEKAGPFMGNLKVGPAIQLDDFPTQFALEVEIAGALDRNKSAYLGFNPQFQFADRYHIINLTGTFQYDVELPVKGLFLYPKINLGLNIYGIDNYRDPGLSFTLQPEFGIKYQVHKNFHIGAEPISVPLYMGGNAGRGAGFDAQYRIWFYGGFDV
jgi:hypothetical protein